MQTMFDWLKFKTNPKAALPLHLGDVAVTPNSIATDWFNWGTDKTHLLIKQWIVESLDLTFESDIEVIDNDYYLLDIVVSYNDFDANGLVRTALQIVTGRIQFASATELR